MTAGKRKDQELETARRHVREGADRVARQEALVLRLNRLGHVELAQQAHRILSTLKPRSHWRARMSWNSCFVCIRPN
jgi:hypothetical protein